VIAEPKISYQLGAEEVVKEAKARPEVVYEEKLPPIE